MVLSKLSRLYREGGLSGLAWRSFSYFYKNVVRVAMPRSDGHIFYAGVSMGRRKKGDWLLPKLFNTHDLCDAPGYEEALITSLQSQVRPGDAVVVVGVGLGVTSVAAAQSVGRDGAVKCFEGDLQGCASLLRVAAINGMTRIAPRHFIQTPNYWFPIEPHFRLPFIHWLPMSVRVWIIRHGSFGFYPRAISAQHALEMLADANLLTATQFAQLFPQSEIKKERFIFTKSLIAIKR